MKKVISLLLSLTMLLSIVSVVDLSAYADTLTTGKCGENVTYSFESDTGVLTIRGTGKMTDYGRNHYSPFNRNSNIKLVDIENGVTSIGNSAFSECTSLISVTIPDSVTSIGNGAFSICTSLTNLRIPNSVTSIDSSAFEYCTKLTSVEIPDSLSVIGACAFYNCASLSNVIIPNSVTRIGDSAFQGCTSLANITIPNSVTSIGNSAFYYCTSLISVTIPDSVTSIGYSAFRGCTSLTSITISNSVTSIGYGAFSMCGSLISIKVINNENYISVDGILFNKDKTELIVYPAGITDCSYEIPNSVTHIGSSAFAGCTNLTSVTISNSVTHIGSSAFEDCKSLTSITIPDSVTSIGNYTFENCTSLTNVMIFDGVISIGERTFYNCINLVSLTIPNSVTSIGTYAFEDCKNLKNIIVFNPNCKFGSYIVNRSVKIYGFANSTANKYANSNGNIFIKIYCNDYNLKHNYESKILSQPTCTKKGVTRYTCARCGYSHDEENIEVLGDLGHNYVSKVIKQPTCTAKGTTRYTCSYCGDTYDAEVSALGHDYVSKVLIQPTCTEKGVTRYTCTRCNDYYDKENIAALGGAHNYVSKVLTQPTCTEKGTTRYTCSRCGDSYNKDDIATLGHNYVSKVLAQPTCTEKGTTRYTCSRCGDSYDKDDIATLGHNYVSKVLTQPTCTEKGVTRYTCTRCNNYYDKEDIEELGHDTKIVERVEPTLTEDGFYRVECQRDGCGYSNSHSLEQLTLGYNQKVKSNGSDTYKIEMDKSGYLIFDFEGESKKWDINIYDEDYNKIDTLKPVYKEFYKKSYLQISLGSNVPNKNQIAALFAGKYYVEIDRVNDATNDNFSGNYTFSIDYSPANETIKETKNDFYYDAPTAKNIELNKTYNGFLGAKYACYNYVGNPILTTDERDAYKIEIPKGSGLSQFSVTLSSKAFAPLGSDCTLILYNSEFEPYDGFKPLTVSLNSTLNETIYLYEGTYYIAVVNDKSPIEYTFTTTFKPQGTFTCVEHKGKLVNTVNPTCTQNGYNSYVCQICGTLYNEIIPAYGHNVVIDYEVAPTLVSSGLTRGSHCSICGAVITPQTVIPQISVPTQPTTTTTAAKPVAKPKSAKIKKVKSAKKAISVEWKKVSGVKGYQIQAATDKKFKKNKKTVTVKKQKTTKTTIKKLKAKKKYYVRIRTYKTVNGKKVYSSWSKVKTIKTK